MQFGTKKLEKAKISIVKVKIHKCENWQLAPLKQTYITLTPVAKLNKSLSAVIKDYIAGNKNERYVLNDTLPQ